MWAADVVASVRLSCLYHHQHLSKHLHHRHRPPLCDHRCRRHRYRSRSWVSRGHPHGGWRLDLFHRRHHQCHRQAIAIILVSGNANVIVIASNIVIVVRGSRGSVLSTPIRSCCFVFSVWSMCMVWIWHLSASMYGAAFGRARRGILVLESIPAQTLGSMQVCFALPSGSAPLSRGAHCGP